MAARRFLAASVMNVGSVSVDKDVKAPSDLLLVRLISDTCQRKGDAAVMVLQSTPATTYKRSDIQYK